MVKIESKSKLVVNDKQTEQEGERLDRMAEEHGVIDAGTSKVMDTDPLVEHEGVGDQIIASVSRSRSAEFNASLIEK